MKKWRPPRKCDKDKEGVTWSRYQNMGKEIILRMLDAVSRTFDIDWCTILGNIWRRSAVTCLANSGMSIINLNRAGRWKYISSCEEYLEHFMKIHFDLMHLLDGITGDEEDLVSKVS